MARLALVRALCVAALLLQSTFALPSRPTSGISNVQKPLALKSDALGTDRADDDTTAAMNSAKDSLDPFIDVPFPSWLPHHVITGRRDLIAALSMARTLGSKSFTAAYPKILLAIKPSDLSLSLSATTSALATLHRVSLPDALARAADLLLSGLAGPQGIKQIASNYTCNSVLNTNTHKSRSTIYPSAGREDAPYDLSEMSLRSAIYIPADFTFGKRMPLLFVSGTGVTACETYSSNFGKILQNSSLADPIFLNMRSRGLDNHQNNAEFIAYAINYISGISGGSNVSVMAYSGVNMATQWALKYWPSARDHVSAYIAISPDYYGTALTTEMCTLGEACPPAILQQSYGSVFARTLVNNGGHSAYVPTTAIWSVLNEYITPHPSAALYTDLQDAHGAGLTLNPIQSVCGDDTPAGQPEQSYAGVLYNAHAVAVSLDALSHKGTANLEHAEASCHKKIADGLNVHDLMRTEALHPLAALSVNNFAYKVTEEPGIKPYAQKDLPEL